MIAQTLIVGVLLGVLALGRKVPGSAIGVLVFSMLVWPEYLRVPLGVFDTSVPRLVALVLIGKAVARGQQRKVSMCGVDHMVLAIWAWTVLASLIAGSPFMHVSQMIGRGLDTVLMYFVVRFYVTSIADLRGLAWWLALLAVVMGVLGAVEAVTGRSPYSGMTEFRAWSWFDKDTEVRLGLVRARASTSVHIFFGLAMMLVTGMLWSIHRGMLHSRLGWLAVLFGLVGALSSMSSGPWLACALMFAFALYRNRVHLIKPSLVLLVLASVALEVASNRHFYNLIDYLALDSHTAWYRTRLLEVAFSRLSEFWAVGVGSQWPHHWGAILDGRQHIDVVNHYLIVALYGGLPAMFLYLASHSLAISRVVQLWKDGEAKGLRLLAFHLAVVLIALDFSCLSVGLFGPPLLLSHVLLALIVAVTQLRMPSEPLPEGEGRGHPVGAVFQSRSSYEQ